MCWRARGHRVNLLCEPAKEHPEEKGYVMALDQSALLELLEALKVAGSTVPQVPVKSGGQRSTGVASLRHERTAVPILSWTYAHMGWSVRGAGDRDRTGMASLEGWGSTIELHPRDYVREARPRRQKAQPMAINRGFSPLRG